VPAGAGPPSQAPAIKVPLELLTDGERPCSWAGFLCDRFRVSRSDSARGSGLGCWLLERDVASRGAEGVPCAGTGLCKAG